MTGARPGEWVVISGAGGLGHLAIQYAKTMGRGSFVGNREDMAEALTFAARGKVKADIELQPLTAINDVFDRLEHGKVAARVVLDFARVWGARPHHIDNRFAGATASGKPEEL